MLVQPVQQAPDQVAGLGVIRRLALPAHGNLSGVLQHRVVLAGAADVGMNRGRVGAHHLVVVIGHQPVVFQPDAQTGSVIGDISSFLAVEIPGRVLQHHRCVLPGALVDVGDAIDSLRPQVGSQPRRLQAGVHLVVRLGRHGLAVDAGSDFDQGDARVVAVARRDCLHERLVGALERSGPVHRDVFGVRAAVVRPAACDVAVAGRPLPLRVVEPLRNLVAAAAIALVGRERKGNGFAQRSFAGQPLVHVLPVILARPAAFDAAPAERHVSAGQPRVKVGVQVRPVEEGVDARVWEALVARRGRRLPGGAIGVRLRAGCFRCTGRLRLAGRRARFMGNAARIGQ